MCNREEHGPRNPTETQVLPAKTAARAKKTAQKKSTHRGQETVGTPNPVT